MIEWKMTVLYSQLQFCTLWINEKASKNNSGSLWREKKKCTNCIQIRDDTHVTSMKIAQFSRPSSPLVQLRPKFFHALELDVQFQTPPSPPTSTLPPPPLSKWYKRKHNPRMTIKCYQVFPSGRLSFSVQYQLINLVWLSVYFFLFNWSQSFPQSNFKKLKISPFCPFLF